MPPPEPLALAESALSVPSVPPPSGRPAPSWRPHHTPCGGAVKRSRAGFGALGFPAASPSHILALSRYAGRRYRVVDRHAAIVFPVSCRVSPVGGGLCGVKETISPSP